MTECCVSGNKWHQHELMTSLHYLEDSHVSMVLVKDKCRNTNTSTMTCVSSPTQINWSLCSDRIHTNTHKQVPTHSQPIRMCNRQQLVGSWPAGVPLSCAVDHPSLCSAGCSWPAALRLSASAGCSGAGLPAVMNAPSEVSPPRTTHAPAAQEKQRRKLGWCRTT